MPKCDYCGAEVYLPYKCKYCGGIFCAEHHLPENHNCPGLKRGEWTPTYMPSRYALEYKVYTEEELRRPKFRLPALFSPDELKDLVLAMMAIFLVYFSIAINYFHPIAFLYILVAVFTGFFLHEMAHRFTAIHFGYRARFVATREGLIITALSALLPIKIIAPGHVAIYTYSIDRRKLGLISLAGPLSNLLIALTALILPISGLLKLFILIVNLDIAFFNMIPLGILDGYKIFKWDKAVWAIFFIIVLALWVYVRF